jgi:hypothetical protein
MNAFSRNAELEAARQRQGQAWRQCRCCRHRARSPLDLSTASTTSPTATPSCSGTPDGCASSRSIRQRSFFERECFGRAASLRTKTLLPRGTWVRFLPEPATDRVDQYGRLLRYVIRVRDGVDVNIRLVTVRKLGLWRTCPRTPYNPYKAIATRR